MNSSRTTKRRVGAQLAIALVTAAFLSVGLTLPAHATTCTTPVVNAVTQPAPINLAGQSSVVNSGIANCAVTTVYDDDAAAADGRLDDLVRPHPRSAISLHLGDPGRIILNDLHEVISVKSRAVASSGLPRVWECTSPVFRVVLSVETARRDRSCPTVHRFGAWGIHVLVGCGWNTTAVPSPMKVGDGTDDIWRPGLVYRAVTRLDRAEAGLQPAELRARTTNR